MKLIENIKVKSQSNFAVNPNGIVLKFHSATKKDYQEIVKVFDELRVEQFLFLNKSTQPFKVVVRGLSIDMDHELISKEVKKTFPVISVAKIITGRNLDVT